MTRNVGLLDRAARFVIGVALLGLYGALESPLRYLTLVGFIFIATAVTAACPVYGLLGWSTRRAGHRQGKGGPDQGEKAGKRSASRWSVHEPDDADGTWPPEKPPPWRPSDPQ